MDKLYTFAWLWQQIDQIYLLRVADSPSFQLPFIFKIVSLFLFP